MLVGIAAFGVIAFGVMDVRPNPFMFVVIALSGYAYWRGSVVLRVDQRGVLIGRGFGYAYGDTRPLTAHVPWSSIAEVLLVHLPGAEEHVAVRLRADAPLPWNVRGIIRDPNAPGPIAPELRTSLGHGKLDRAALSAAVATFGSGVAVVETSQV